MKGFNENILLEIDIISLAIHKNNVVKTSARKEKRNSFELLNIVNCDWVLKLVSH